MLKKLLTRFNPFRLPTPAEITAVEIATLNKQVETALRELTRIRWLLFKLNHDQKKWNAILKAATEELQCHPK
jgi:hypothetical protein